MENVPIFMVDKLDREVMESYGFGTYITILYCARGRMTGKSSGSVPSLQGEQQLANQNGHTSCFGCGGRGSTRQGSSKEVQI